MRGFFNPTSFTDIENTLLVLMNCRCVYIGETSVLGFDIVDRVKIIRRSYGGSIRFVGYGRYR
jgi:hypothetical protein